MAKIDCDNGRKWPGEYPDFELMDRLRGVRKSLARVMEQAGKQAGHKMILHDCRVSRSEKGWNATLLDCPLHQTCGRQLREKMVNIIRDAATDVTETQVGRGRRHEQSEETFRRVLDNAIDTIYWPNLKTCNTIMGHHLRKR